MKKLPKVKNIGRASYTIQYNNKLNTFTGPVHLPWGFLILKKNSKFFKYVTLYY